MGVNTWLLPNLFITIVPTLPEIHEHTKLQSINIKKNPRKRTKHKWEDKIDTYIRYVSYIHYIETGLNWLVMGPIVIFCCLI